MAEAEAEAKATILANPARFSAAFSSLVRQIAELIGPDDDNYKAYQELASYEMPPEFMVWYYNGTNVPKFTIYEMFRKKHKISAMDVINRCKIMHIDPFSRNGGRKMRSRTQMRSRVRRQKRRTNRRR